MWKEAEEGIEALSAGEQKKPEVRFARARVSLALGKHADAVSRLDKLEDELPLLRDAIGKARAQAALVAGPVRPRRRVVRLAAHARFVAHRRRGLGEGRRARQGAHARRSRARGGQEVARQRGEGAHAPHARDPQEGRRLRGARRRALARDQRARRRHRQRRERAAREGAAPRTAHRRRAPRALARPRRRGALRRSASRRRARRQRRRQACVAARSLSCARRGLLQGANALSRGRARVSSVRRAGRPARGRGQLPLRARLLARRSRRRRAPGVRVRDPALSADDLGRSSRVPCRAVACARRSLEGRGARARRVREALPERPREERGRALSRRRAPHGARRQARAQAPRGPRRRRGGLARAGALAGPRRARCAPRRRSHARGRAMVGRRALASRSRGPRSWPARGSLRRARRCR